ncbi:hypothetical protein IQ07DRAFT_202611 [Pyrenochaeta sp. DS3sAY3a]|nr:hypothetical protein IQ07DRAFT_202611 [Pyrenochaeta sp. DS3sAY3a]
MVRDPNFWRRFSIAVHQDEAAKEEMTKRPDLKHSYVQSLSPSLQSPLASPMSQTPLTTGMAPAAVLSPPPAAAAFSPLSPLSPLAPSTPTRPTIPPKRQRSKLQKTPSMKPLLRPTIQLPEPTAAKQPSKSTAAARPTHRRPSLPFTRHTNSSAFSLSGRPRSHYTFWTTITADPTNSDSWLESQKRKQRQRTWICWVFWLCLLLFVAGIVVTLLVLKGRKII